MNPFASTMFMGDPCPMKSTGILSAGLPPVSIRIHLD